MTRPKARHLCDDPAPSDGDRCLEVAGHFGFHRAGEHTWRFENEPPVFVAEWVARARAGELPARIEGGVAR